MRRATTFSSLILASWVLPWVLSAQAETVVRYGISLADIPLTTGQPDRGAGAYQFTGHTIYDSLVAWEMDIADRPGKLIAGLATEWKVDGTDQKRWTFALRHDVKFHDGSTFNADAVIWNLDDYTIEITTKEVDSFFPYQMLWFLVSSPAQYEKVGRDWDKFASAPAGI